MAGPLLLRTSSAAGTSAKPYTGTSLTRTPLPLGPYRRPMPRVLGGWAFSCGRGTPVLRHSLGDGAFMAPELAVIHGLLEHEVPHRS